MKLRYWGCIQPKEFISDIPGVKEAFSLSRMIPLSSETTDVLYEGEISNYSDSFVEAKIHKIVVSYSSSGIEKKSQELCFCRYNIENNTFEQNFSNVFEEFDEMETLGTSFFNEVIPLMFPVCAYIQNNKPYCARVLEELRGATGNRYTLVKNILSIAAYGLEDEFEKVYKQDSAIVLDKFGSMDVKSIIKEFSSKSIPKKCKDWLLNSKWALSYRVPITSLLSTISEKEDGNNAIIVAKFLEDSSRLMDKRSYSWSSRFLSFISSLQWLVEFGYNSKTVLEYVIRQNFYFSYPFDFPSEEIHLLMDYVNMAKDIKKDFDKLPNNIRKAHNIVLSNTKMLEVNDEMRDKFTKAVENYKNLELSINDPITHKKWVVMAPDSPEEVVREGISLNHCVSSYVSLIANGISQILFLRAADNPYQSLYTLEVNSGIVTEAKGNYNEDVPSDIANLIHDIEKEWNKGTV